MTDAETWNATSERVPKARKKLGQINKAAIFAALAAADIELVLATFDGVGDSGQIEEVTASRSERPVDFPDVKIKLLQASWNSAAPDATEAGLREAIETLCYDFLEEDHGGWENNEGAFGEFRLDVAARTVELEFHFRYVDTFTTHLTY